MNPLLFAISAAKAAPSAVATPPIPVAPAPTTWFTQHAPWLTHGLAGLFIISAISLIVLLAFQTTKQEGLTGSIGGRVESAYRGRLGAEEQLKRATGAAAVCFVIFGFILSLTGI
ncbi:MAG: preprotein translocase subunit SecG [Candidatus Eremiobacteraeota bacterium]|nr:preprotein translocase subunit SecG [Candidatus Eremiobacteraeota bacterium]